MQIEDVEFDELDGVGDCKLVEGLSEDGLDAEIDCPVQMEMLELNVFEIGVGVWIGFRLGVGDLAGDSQDEDDGNANL